VIEFTFFLLIIYDVYYRLFPDLVEKEILKYLYPVQEEKKEIWRRIDKKYEKEQYKLYIEITTKRQVRSSHQSAYAMIQKLHQKMGNEFEDEYQLYCM
jgi:hypothetical protein